MGVSWGWCRSSHTFIMDVPRGGVSLFIRWMGSVSTVAITHPHAWLWINQNHSLHKTPRLLDEFHWHPYLQIRLLTFSEKQQDVSTRVAMEMKTVWVVCLTKWIWMFVIFFVALNAMKLDGSTPCSSLPPPPPPTWHSHLAKQYLDHKGHMKPDILVKCVLGYPDHQFHHQYVGFSFKYSKAT